MFFCIYITSKYPAKQDEEREARIKIFGLKGEQAVSRLAIFLAAGFEEIEALTVVDLCRRSGLEIDMVSITEERRVTGSHGICVEADTVFAEAAFEQYEMLILPGGMPGTKNLEAHGGLMEKLDTFFEEERYIGAICAAPSVLGHRGILKGKKACCYPGFEEQLEGAEATGAPVEKDGKVITSRGMGTAIDFGLAIVETFCGKEQADSLAKSIIYR